MEIPAIIDIIAVVILLGFAGYGARRGLFRTLAGLLVILLALVGARLTAEAITAPAMELVLPVVERQMENKLDAALAASDQAGQMPEDHPEGLLALLGVQEEKLADLTEKVQEGMRDTGVSVLTAVAECLTEPILYSVLFLLSFLLLTLLLNLLSKLLDLALKLPVLHGANTLGGALAGLLEGAVVLLLLVLILQRLDVPLEGSRILHIYTTWLS